MHNWTDGEPITAAKLNKLELKKALATGEQIDFTQYTWQEIADLESEIPCHIIVRGPIPQADEQPDDDY